MSVTSIRLNADIEAPLESLSKKLDRSKNYIINQAIKEYVQRQSMEDARWEETLQALDAVKQDKTLNENDVNAWLESWGSVHESPPPKS